MSEAAEQSDWPPRPEPGHERHLNADYPVWREVPRPDNYDDPEIMTITVEDNTKSITEWLTSDVWLSLEEVR